MIVDAGGTQTCVHPHVSCLPYHCATDTESCMYTRYTQMWKKDINKQTDRQKSQSKECICLQAALWKPAQINLFSDLSPLGLRLLSEVIRKLSTKETTTADRTDLCQHVPYLISHCSHPWNWAESLSREILSKAQFKGWISCCVITQLLNSSGNELTLVTPIWLRSLLFVLAHLWYQWLDQEYSCTVNCIIYGVGVSQLL